jgi:hypothetical protein
MAPDDPPPEVPECCRSRVVGLSVLCYAGLGLDLRTQSAVLVPCWQGSL